MTELEGCSSFSERAERAGGQAGKYKSKIFPKTIYRIWRPHDPLPMREIGTGCICYSATYQISLANSYELRSLPKTERLLQSVTSLLSKREFLLGCPAKLGGLTCSKKGETYTVRLLLRCSGCPLSSTELMDTCDKKEKLLNWHLDTEALSEL